MKIDDAVHDVSGFYAVNFEVFSQTLEESTIECSFDMGGGVEIKHGRRYGLPIWLMDNPAGKLYGIWVEYEDNLH
ncbi:hypothetical protein G6698_06530 [Polynucleobacter paneuropaeus]|nr:hypothetical protein [Polynucleobacter paneuropaeus]MBT8577344.1 hypothetical protein [Polynucleobacter paneuropaeus]